MERSGYYINDIREALLVKMLCCLLLALILVGGGILVMAFIVGRTKMDNEHF